MLFTPHHNWPIAEDTDVLKQYPATIDAPFKEALDLLTAVTVGPGLILDYPVGAFKMRAGSVVSTTDGAGAIWITYPAPFPTTSYFVVAVNGGAPGNGYCVVSTDDQTPEGVKILSYLGGGGVNAGAAIRVNYIAFGE